MSPPPGIQVGPDKDGHRKDASVEEVEGDGPRTQDQEDDADGCLGEEPNLTEAEKDPEGPGDNPPEDGRDTAHHGCEKEEEDEDGSEGPMDRDEKYHAQEAIRARLLR